MGSFKAIQYTAETGYFAASYAFRIVVLECFASLPPGLLSWISPSMLSGRPLV